MLGSGKAPAAPAYQPAPQGYQAAPAYQNAPSYQTLDFNSMVPQAATAPGIMDSGLAAEGKLTQYAPWLSLQNNPTSPENVQRAMRDYLQRQGLPQMAQDESNLFANGQGGSSYAGAYLGQEQAMNNLNAWNAGLAQQQADFSNVIAARNALYTQPIGMAGQQNALDVQRGLGIGSLESAQNDARNQYNLANSQNQNTYNLGNTQLRNNFGQAQLGYNQGLYGIGANNATARAGQATSFNSGLINAGTSLFTGSANSKGARGLGLF